VQGEQAGQVQVAYLEERPDADEGPFLKGERALLTAVAERLGNILEGKQSQVALLENEQKFRALFHGMPVPVYTWQRSGQDIVLVDANFEAESITGGTIGDFLGTTLSAMYSDRPDIVQDISHTFAGKVSFQREMAYSFKSTGEDKTLLVKYTYVPPDLVMVQTEDVTQQRRAEQALQESKSRLDLSIAGSQGGLWHIRLDPEAPSDTLPDEIYLSPRMKSFLGFQDDEFPNSMPAWGNQILPEDLPKLRENSLKFRTGEIDHYGFEYRIRHKDGSIRWLQTSGQLEYDRDGRVILFAGIDWDITARKQVELQIRFQANLLDAVEQAVVVTNPEGEVIYWNPFAEKLYGWPAEEVISGKTNEFIVDNCGQLKNIQIAETLKAGNSWAGEYIARCRDGTLLTVQSTISVISDQSGIYYIGVAHDISDRKQAEIALKASEEKYRDLVEKVSDVIYSVDAEGILTYASPAIESLLGISPEEAIGQPVAGFMLPDDLDRINQNFQKLMSGMVLSLNEYRMVTASSETRWVRISSQPINVDGRVTGLQGVLTDITERKILEEQLEVEATSAERERLARGLHDTVTQSLYSINLQSDAIKMALSSGENDKAERRLQILKEIAQEAMNEMRLLIYQMHPSILQKAGLAAALRQRLDAVEVRSGLVTDFQVESERRLPLEIESILFQIAQEGLNNVLKHAKANEIQVRISYKPDGCRLTIQDDGVGFDAESIHRYGGYGLENMRDQLEKINGWLSIDSQPGKGTTLEIEVIL
jgi:PAS domain S-box-containing protein